MNDRIKQIQLALKMSQKDFAEAIGIAPGALSNIYSNRTNATSNHVNGIHKAFPQININWLMFGEGDMYNQPTASQAADGTAEQAQSPSANTLENNSQPNRDLFSGTDDAAGTIIIPAGASQLRDHYAPTSRPSRATYADSRQSAREMVEEVFPRPKKVDIIKPKIKEIRVFYDDGTYETFVPSK